MQITTLFYVALQALSVVALPKTAKPPAPPKPILRTYNWNVDWVSASPDGTPRPFVGINGQWPCPSIIANAGDTIKINVVNNLGNETTAIHFHGLFQQGSNNMDGPAMVTQCPIVPGQSKYSGLLKLSYANLFRRLCVRVQGERILGCTSPKHFTDVSKQLNQTGTYWYHAHVGGQYIGKTTEPQLARSNLSRWSTRIDYYS